MLKYRYFEQLEQELLLQSYTYFSPYQIRAIERRLRLEENPDRLMFTRYLQAVIAFKKKDYRIADAYFAQVDILFLPKASRHFCIIYKTIAHFIMTEGALHCELERLKQELPPEFYAYLLAKLIIYLYPFKHHRDRCFYLRLQLSTLLPTLAPSHFLAHLYYELAQFYLVTLPNEVIAFYCLEKTQAFLTLFPDERLALMTQIALAYCSSLTDDHEKTVAYYDGFIWDHRNSQLIDSFHFYSAVINALHFFIRIKKQAEIDLLFPKLKQIASVTDPQKRDTLTFNSYCLRLHWLLSRNYLDKAEITKIIHAGDEILPRLQEQFLLGFPKLHWILLRGEIAATTGDYTSAKNYFDEALSTSIDNQLMQFQIQARRALSQVFSARGHFEQAIQHFQIADTLQSDLLQQQNNHFLFSLYSQEQAHNWDSLMSDEISLQQQLMHKVSTDALTTLGNRQALSQFQIQHSDTLPLYCAMIDIDYFKRYNDYYGHLAGDEIIKTFAKTLKLTCKNYTLIRYGGEEFCVLAPNGTKDDFIAAITAFQTELAQLKLPHLGLNSAAFVTASIGISSRLKRTQSIRELIAQADEALYKSKNNGRNQMSIAT